MATMLFVMCVGILSAVVMALAGCRPAQRGSAGRVADLRLSDLWRCDGTIDRGPYALIGLVGFAVKHNLDRWVATAIFHRRWGIFNYVMPPGDLFEVTSLSKEDVRFLVTLVALALPFIWIGVVLTLRRLRSAGLPTWLVVVFFLPIINLAFFLLLAVLPARPQMGVAQEPATRRWLTRLIPDHPIGSAAMALAVSLVFGAALTQLSVAVFSRYGWGLFVATPFGLGLLSTLLYGYHRPRRYASCLAVSLAATGLLGLGLLALAVEGVVCLVMAAPIALVLAGIGGSIGYVIQRRRAPQLGEGSTLLVVALFVPTLMSVESLSPPPPPLFAVQTTIEVDAPPERVWQQVISFPDLPPPDEWLFRMGIAYPMRAVIDGHGIGAQRHCVFSTGTFIEPIQVWDAPWVLRFAVTSNPPPMQEWTPYADIHPPHLRGFLVSEAGQFRLTAQADGRTRLEGTTWYRHHMWPAMYWRLWSDFIIHRIHLRVLTHIKRLAEQGRLAG